MTPLKIGSLDEPEVKQEKEKKAPTLEAVLKAIYADRGLKFTRLGERANQLIDVLPFNIFGLDHDLLGVGGIPRGRVVEIYGPESSGKTTAMLQLIASAQSRGEEVGFVDAEHALDPRYARNLGVDTDKLLVAQPDYGEQALAAVDHLVDSGLLKLIVVDSVAALVPKAELEGEIGDAHVGLQARMMSQTLRMITAKAAKTGTIVCFINQIREKIGVMFGSPETTTGGRALKFYSSVRVDIRRIAQVKQGDENVGNKTKIKIVKNKVDAPFRDYEGFELIFGKGLDDVANTFDYAVMNGVIGKDKANLTYKDQAWRGRNNMIEDLRGLPDVLREIKIETLKAMGKPQEYIDKFYPAPKPEKGKK